MVLSLHSQFRIIFLDLRVYLAHPRDCSSILEEVLCVSTLHFERRGCCYGMLASLQFPRGFGLRGTAIFSEDRRVLGRRFDLLLDFMFLHGHECQPLRSYFVRLELLFCFNLAPLIELFSFLCPFVFFHLSRQYSYSHSI